MCLGARAHSLSVLSGRLVGYDCDLRYFQGATLMWRKIGEAAGQWKNLRSFSLVPAGRWRIPLRLAGPQLFVDGRRAIV